MKVNVKFFATIRNTTNTSETTVDIKGSSVGDVIDTLVTRYGDGFRKEVLESDGNIKKHIRVLLNGNFIDRNDPLKHPVGEENTLYLFPPVAGG